MHTSRSLERHTVSAHEEFSWVAEMGKVLALAWGGSNTVQITLRMCARYLTRKYVSYSLSLRFGSEIQIPPVGRWNLKPQDQMRSLREGLCQSPKLQL